ncbi:peptide upstream protein [Thalictrum thalictroides]|uniref:Peptide upstream protein n=1 Tax=Thalictrum thalictroides TaxID=46969 RepID=A0A7J6VPD2_THATH|nr:peptide upstream protein [Thalictrum thalictroides]
MNFVVLKSQILRGSIAKRLVLRAFLVMFALAMFPYLQVVRDAEPTNFFTLNRDGCALDVDSNPLAFPGKYLKPMSNYVFASRAIPCKEMANITKDMFRVLMDEKFLKLGAKALCVGEETASAVFALQELGFANTFGMNRRPFFTIMRKGFIYDLEFEDDSFDFVFSNVITRVNVPALLVLEIERVLRAGGIGAMLLYAPHLNPGSLIKSATPISLFLKCSDVLHVRSVHESYSLVVFKKKVDWINPFEHYQLPDECPSIIKNKPFLEHLEPLLEENSAGLEGGFSYLSKFMNISSRKRFIYIDIGAGQFMNANTTHWFQTFYPIPAQAVDVYVVHHNTTVLSSYVNRPGVTFVYHPGLAGGNESDANINPAGENEGFDFLVWFKETVAAGDFVVLKMNAVGVELQLLHELFETGGICLVDELFIRCPDSLEGLGTMGRDCMGLFKGLRSTGVFAHQWLDN